MPGLGHGRLELRQDSLKELLSGLRARHEKDEGDVATVVQWRVGIGSVEKKPHGLRERFGVAGGKDDRRLSCRLRIDFEAREVCGQVKLLGIGAPGTEVDPARPNEGTIEGAECSGVEVGGIAEDEAGKAYGRQGEVEGAVEASAVPYEDGPAVFVAEMSIVDCEDVHYVA